MFIDTKRNIFIWNSFSFYISFYLFAKLISYDKHQVRNLLLKQPPSYQENSMRSPMVWCDQGQFIGCMKAADGRGACRA